MGVNSLLHKQPVTAFHCTGIALKIVISFQVITGERALFGLRE